MGPTQRPRAEVREASQGGGHKPGSRALKEKGLGVDEETALGQVWPASLEGREQRLYQAAQIWLFSVLAGLCYFFQGTTSMMCELISEHGP